ncbi:MAG: hypothetical protein ABJF23_17115 [Bryobacteraceae bacterium]
MAADGKLNLEIMDVHGVRLHERVDINLFNQGLAERLVLRAVDASKKIVISNLRSGPEGLYRIEIDPPSFLPVNRFVTIPSGRAGELTVTCPVDPNKVVRVDFSPYESLKPEPTRVLESSNAVLGFPGSAGKGLFGALDDLRKAGMMNIFAKSLRTRYPSGKSVVDYVASLREVRQDRFFVNVSQELRDETMNSVSTGFFHPVSASLHSPPEGFTGAGSFKTADSYGNLQLTFWQRAAEWVADIDIDDAAGLEHIFQVVRNSLSGRPTHPYDIHEILLAYQEIDPGYDLVLYETKPKVASAEKSSAHG